MCGMIYVQMCSSINKSFLGKSKDIVHRVHIFFPFSFFFVAYTVRGPDIVAIEKVQHLIFCAVLHLFLFLVGGCRLITLHSQVVLQYYSHHDRSADFVISSRPRRLTERPSQIRFWASPGFRPAHRPLPILAFPSLVAPFTFCHPFSPLL